MANDTHYITNKKGKKISVVLSVKEYETMLEKLEELEDIKAYDKAKKRELQFVDAETVFKEIENKRKIAYV